MKKFAVFLLSVLPAFAAGTVNQVSQQLGISNTWALTMSWTGDPTSGAVPVVAAKLPTEIGFGQGYRILSAETAPGTPAPTNGYAVALNDSLGLDLLGGTAVSLSSANAQTFNGNAMAPIYGAFSLAVTGNSAGGGAGKVIIYISPVSAIVISPSSVPVPPFSQPATAAVPSPGSASLPVNTKLAQTVNVADFTPATQVPCSGSAHDDTFPAILAANYIGLNGGGTVVFPEGKQCWYNSDTFGSTSVTIAGNNVTLDGNGSTINSTLNEPGLIFGPAAAASAANQVCNAMVSLNCFSFTSFGPGGLPTVTVQSGKGATMPPGTPVYYQSGTVLSGTPINSEVNVVSTQNGDVLTLKYPIEHTFTYSAPPDGIGPIPAAWMQQNFTLKNFKTQPQLGKSPFSIVNVINGQVQNLDMDMVPDREPFLTGDSRNVTLSHVTAFVQPINHPCFQYSTGMSDTLLEDVSLNCSAPGACTGLDFSEGSSNNSFKNSKYVGNCPVNASTFHGAYITGNDINVNSGNGAVMVFTGSGTETATDLEIAGNHIKSADMTNASNIFIAIPGSRVMGNKFDFVSPNTHGAITFTNNASGSIFSGNTGTFGGWALTHFSLTDHNFTDSGNNFTCSGSGCTGAPGIFVNNDGTQTVSETITGNTLTGFGIGIWIFSMASEFHPVLAPNSVLANTMPYDPAVIGTVVPGLVGNAVTNVQVLFPPICGAITSGTALTAGAQFMWDFGPSICAGGTGFQMAIPPSSKFDFFVGDSTGSAKGFWQYNIGIDQWSFAGVSGNIWTGTSSLFTSIVPFVPSGGITLPGGGASHSGGTCTHWTSGLCDTP